MKRPEILQGIRMLFDRDVVQLARLAAERLPRRQEIQAQAEARLQDHELVAPAPRLRQAVAAEEHVAGLREATLVAVVDVAIARRIRRPGIGEDGFGGIQ